MLAATAITATVARAAPRTRRITVHTMRPSVESSRTPSPISPATLAARGGHRTPNPAPPSTLPVGAASMAFHRRGWPNTSPEGHDPASFGSYAERDGPWRTRFRAPPPRPEPPAAATDPPLRR